MLVQYTQISTLSVSDLEALKKSVQGLTLEGRGSHWAFNGKTFNMAELISYQRMWENKNKQVGTQLNG